KSEIARYNDRTPRHCGQDQRPPDEGAHPSPGHGLAIGLPEIYQERKVRRHFCRFFELVRQTQQFLIPETAIHLERDDAGCCIDLPFDLHRPSLAPTRTLSRPSFGSHFVGRLRPSNEALQLAGRRCGASRTLQPLAAWFGAASPGGRRSWHSPRPAAE